MKAEQRRDASRPRCKCRPDAKGVGCGEQSRHWAGKQGQEAAIPVFKLPGASKVLPHTSHSIRVMSATSVTLCRPALITPYVQVLNPSTMMPLSPNLILPAAPSSPCVRPALITPYVHVLNQPFNQCSLNPLISAPASPCVAPYCTLPMFMWSVPPKVLSPQGLVVPGLRLDAPCATLPYRTVSPAPEPAAWREQTNGQGIGISMTGRLRW